MRSHFDWRASRGEGYAIRLYNPHADRRSYHSRIEQIVLGKGYDHNFVVNGRNGTLRRAARASDPTSGRVMEVWTTEPGVQLYTGNYLDGSKIGKGGKVYNTRYGFCLRLNISPIRQTN